MKGYPRREFVVRALAACGACVLSSETLLRATAQQSPSSGVRVAQAAAGYFGGHADAAAKVGTAYLRQMKADTSPSSIVASARGTLTLIERGRNQEKAIEAIVSAVQRDFREGRTVQVDGWILSRTEAELCALTLLPATQ